jgi:hypothetical protein
VADLVSAPIATFVTTGGCQVLLRSSLALPPLIAPIGRPPTIKPSSVLWDKVSPGKTDTKLLRRSPTDSNKAAT